MGFRSSGGLPVAGSSVFVAQQSASELCRYPSKKLSFLSSAVTTLPRTEP